MGTNKCALKIDLHKTFNFVRWDFLLTAMAKTQFPHCFINWFRACVCTPMFLVKLNDTLNGYFTDAKGLHQGDPLSLYLFTIVTTPHNSKHH